MEKLKSLAQVAEALGLSRRALYSLVQRGKVPAYKVGGRILFKESEIEAWLQACKKGEEAKE
jgi:excisionase family DNA binding protein